MTIILNADQLIAGISIKKELLQNILSALAFIGRSVRDMIDM